jgi:GNAT superfamily N-acetyltransferase
MSPMPITVKVLDGWPSLAEGLASGGLGREWAALAAEAGPGAVFQSPAFVMPWYEAYRPQIEPVVALGYDPYGALCGVMPLMRPRAGRAALRFAGGVDARGGGWVARHAQDADFGAAGLSELAERGLLGDALVWRAREPLDRDFLEHPHLSRSGLVACVSPGPRAAGGPRAVPEPAPAPDAEARARGADLRLQALAVPDVSPELFGRFAAYCDIQELACRGEEVFRPDPARSEFYRRLLDAWGARALFYGLFARETPLGFSFALEVGGAAVLLWRVVDPLPQPFATAAELAVRTRAALAKRGLTVVDAAPPALGEETNGGETGVTVHVFPSGRAARCHALGGLGRARRWADRIRAAVRGRPVLEVVRAVARAVRKWLWSSESVLVYVLHRGDPVAPLARQQDTLAMRRDTVEDFLLYTGSNRWISRQRMMADAIRSLRQGEHCFTVVDAGVLAHYRWMWPHTTVMRISEVAYEFSLPPGSGVAYDAYTEPAMRGRGFQQIGLRREIEEAFRLGCERVFNATVETNAPSRKNIESVGYRPFARVTRVHRLGRSRASMTPIGEVRPLAGARAPSRSSAA